MKIKKKATTLPSDQVLDGLVRKYIRLISGGYCKRCGKYIDGAIQVAHMYRRRRKTVRWDLRNVYPLCPDCHREVDEDQIKLVSFMYEVMSKKEIADLERLANLTIKQHPIDRGEIRADLKQKIAELEDLSYLNHTPDNIHSKEVTDD